MLFFTVPVVIRGMYLADHVWYWSTHLAFGTYGWKHAGDSKEL